MATHRRAVSREGPGARRRRPNSWPAAPPQTTRKPKSLAGPLAELPATRHFSRKSGVDPAGAGPEGGKRSSARSPKPGCGAWSLFSGQGAQTPCSDQAEVFKEGVPGTASFRFEHCCCPGRRWALRDASCSRSAHSMRRNYGRAIDAGEAARR